MAAVGGLEQIEKDIMLCEQFLSSDKFANAGSSAITPAPQSHAGAKSDEPANRDAAAVATTPSEGRLSAERKKEILDRLLAERAARKAGDVPSTSPGGAGGESSVAARSTPEKRKESREELIQRLVREKRERDARRAAAADGGEAVDGLSRVRRDAWAESSGGAGVRGGRDTSVSHMPGTPDSLDGTSCARATFRGALPEQRSQVKRPASAPKTRPQSKGASSAATVPPGPRGGARKAERQVLQRPKSASGERTTQFADFTFQSRELTNKYSKEALQREREEQLKQELTFKPTINTTYISNANRGAGGSKEETVERLARSRRENWEKRERVRMEAEERALKESCTFKPKIYSKAATHPPAPGIPVEVRLINEANSKHSMRQRAKRHLEEQEFQRTCTFRPKINTTSRYLDVEQRPLHERVGELQRQRRQKLQEAKVKEEQSNPELTFKPAINERSARIAEREGPVIKRLVENSEASLQRKLAKMAEIEIEREREQRFHPSSNPNSDRILSASDRFAGKSFFERQEEDLRRRHAALDEAEVEYTFKPTLGANSDLIVQERERETPEERIDRLAYKDKERQELSREVVQEQYYSQFTFKPRINKVSKQLGHSHTVEELYTDAGRRERMEELIRRANEEQEMECTFQPDTRRVKASSMYDLRQPSMDATGERSRYSIDVHDVETLTERIKHHAMRKDAAIDQERRRREYEELKECTFKPSVCSKPVKPQAGPIIVRGLGRHLELKELAQKKEEEKKERERKAFLLDTTARSSSHVSKPYTVPQPFKLSSNDTKHQERRKALEEELATAEMAACTFRPKVNDGRVQKYLDRILNDGIDADAEASLLQIR